MASMLRLLTPLRLLDQGRNKPAPAILSGLPAQALHAKHQPKLAAASTDAVFTDAVESRPPAKLVQYFEGSPPLASAMAPSSSLQQAVHVQRTALPLTPTAPAAGGPATRKRHGFFVGPAADVLAQQDQLQQQQPRQPPKRRKLSNSSASSVDTGDAGDPSLEAESLAPPGARRNGARNGEQAQMAAPQQFRNVVHELQDQGLPVEMHYVRTQDGYWLPIVRVPLRESRRRIAMHLGMWDDLYSAASLAPLARQDGLDVYLVGNRNCPPFCRDADAPGEYFDYCIDDLGLQDMRAADAKIRELADAELGPSDVGEGPRWEHLKLVHSMAGASMFIYLTDCCLRGEAHGVHHVIAAGPAGFARPQGIAGLATAMLKLLLRLPPNLQTVRAFPIGLTQENMLAEPILRALYDVVSIPPVDKVAAFALRLLMGGDPSKWADAVKREHYNHVAMPVVTWRIVLQILQHIQSGDFIRYDYGPVKNLSMYFTEEPRSVALLYDLLDVHIDLYAGAGDKICSPAAVQKHVDAIHEANARRTARGDPPIPFSFQVLPGCGHLDIIDGQNKVTVDHLRKCWGRQRDALKVKH